MDNTTTPPPENPENLTPTEEPTPAPAPAEPVLPEEPVTQPEPPVTSPAVVAHSSKKSGLKTALIILLVILLAAAAAGAVYMWQQSKVDDLNAQLKAANSTTTVVKKSVTAQQSADPDLTKSTALVKAFYAEYNKDAGTGGDAAQTIISKYGNANLAFYKKYYNFGFDPIICGQDVLADGYTVSGNASKDGVATVTVKDSTSDGIKVRVVDQGGLTVDGVTCPGTAGTEEPHPADN